MSRNNILDKKYPLYFGSVISDAKIKDSRVFALLGIKEGELYTVKETFSLIKNWKKILRDEYNAVSVEINAVIWADNKRYIDIALKTRKNSERRFKKPPEKTPRLPAEAVKNFRKYQNRVNELLKIDVKKTTRYPIDGRWQSKDRTLKKIDETLLNIVPTKIDLILKTLYSHKNPEKRVLALQLLNWAPAAPQILNSILAGLEDPEHSVHNEAASIALPKILYLKNRTSVKKISEMLEHFNLLCRGKAAYIIYVLMKNKITIPKPIVKKILEMGKLKSPFLKFYPSQIKKFTEKRPN
ncbi:MAG: hypothetical protein AAB851_03235 [Patescibacteria group bacterium]